MLKSIRHLALQGVSSNLPIFHSHGRMTHFLIWNKSTSQIPTRGLIKSYQTSGDKSWYLLVTFTTIVYSHISQVKVRPRRLFKYSKSIESAFWVPRMPTTSHPFVLGDPPFFKYFYQNFVNLWI